MGLAAGTQQLEILHVVGLAAAFGGNMGRSLDLGLDATIKGMISHDHVNYGGHFPYSWPFGLKPVYRNRFGSSGVRQRYW